MSCVLFTVFLYVGEGNYQQATKEFLLQGAVDLEVDEVSQQRSGRMDDGLFSVKIGSFMSQQYSH